MNFLFKMTLKYEVTKKLHKKKLVTICLGCNKHQINGEWINYPKQDHYQNYSHGFCEECYQLARKLNGLKKT